jgi:hypothetical protein
MCVASFRGRERADEMHFLQHLGHRLKATRMLVFSEASVSPPRSSALTVTVAM